MRDELRGSEQLTIGDLLGILLGGNKTTGSDDYEERRAALAWAKQNTGKLPDGKTKGKKGWCEMAKSTVRQSKVVTSGSKQELVMQASELHVTLAPNGKGAKRVTQTALERVHLLEQLKKECDKRIKGEKADIRIRVKSGQEIQVGHLEAVLQKNQRRSVDWQNLVRAEYERTYRQAGEDKKRAKELAQADIDAVTERTPMTEYPEKVVVRVVKGGKK